MHPTKALLVFCEGAHDVAYVSRVLKVLFHAKQENLRFSELPSPFAGFFRTSVKRHAARDLTLDMARKFYLPDRILTKKDFLILLFNVGGKDKADEVKHLLKSFLPLLAHSEVFREHARSAIQEAKYLFLYDADEKTAYERILWTQNTFKVIEGCEWTLNFDAVSKVENRAVSEDGSKAVYVWAGSEGKGTLEDVLIPLCLDSKTSPVEKTETFMNHSFKWDTSSNDTKHAVAEKAKRKKAILTASGQRKKPGGSLFSILDQTDMVCDKALRGCNATQSFVDFLFQFTKIGFQ
jgi:hypothetical protein